MSDLQLQVIGKKRKIGALSNEKLEERSEEKERQELAFKIKPRMGSVGKRS